MSGKLHNLSKKAAILSIQCFYQPFYPAGEFFPGWGRRAFPNSFPAAPAIAVLFPSTISEPEKERFCRNLQELKIAFFTYKFEI